MSESETQQNTDSQSLPVKPVKIWMHLVVTLIILFIAFSIIGGMFATKPEARRFGSRPAPAVAVETANLQAADYQVWVNSYGSATPLTQTNLVSDVSGRVIEVSPNIRAGKSFTKGELLVRIDPRDYQVEVQVAKAAVAESEFRLTQELAQAEIAKRDWNIKPGNPAAKALALREPQVASARAALASTKARLAKAELNLERTKLLAPFDGKVLKQMVDLGQVVNPSQSIAEIYSTDLIEVRLPVKAHDMAHIQLPEDNPNSEFPEVMLESEIGANKYRWQGKIVRSEGAFDAATRMLYLVAQVENPFEATDNSPAMRVGQFLTAKIQGSLLTNVYALPRRAVTQDNQVAIAEEGVLIKRKIEPLWTDAKVVVVSASSGLDNQSADASQMVSASKLNPSDTLILTPTANLVTGTKVKSINQPLADKTDKASGKPAKQTASTSS